MVVMSTAWRIAGLNYVNYSNVAAKTLRRSLKPDLREEASKRDKSHCKYSFWANGEKLPEGQKLPDAEIKTAQQI